MTIEENLKDLILTQHKSLLSFANTTGIPYTTIDNVLKRGIARAGISTMIKICDALNIELDALAKGSIRKKQIYGITLIDDNEKTLVADYRKLNKLGKEKALEDIENLTYVPKYVDTNIRIISDEDFDGSYTPSLIAAHADESTQEDIDLSLEMAKEYIIKEKGKKT